MPTVMFSSASEDEAITRWAYFVHGDADAWKVKKYITCAFASLDEKGEPKKKMYTAGVVDLSIPAFVYMKEFDKEVVASSALRSLAEVLEDEVEEECQKLAMAFKNAERGLPQPGKDLETKSESNPRPDAELRPQPVPAGTRHNQIPSGNHFSGQSGVAVKPNSDEFSGRRRGT